MIELAPDFRDFLIELHDAGAEFVVLGGHAVAFHGHPRATKDLDVLVKPTLENSQRVFEALAQFGVPLRAIGIGPDEFATHEGVVQIGLPPLRIDILTRASGISFEDANLESAVFELEGRSIPVIGLNALLTNKRASGRSQDLADIAALAMNPKREPKR